MQIVALVATKRFNFARANCLVLTILKPINDSTGKSSRSNGSSCRIRLVCFDDSHRLHPNYQISTVVVVVCSQCRNNEKRSKVTSLPDKTRTDQMAAPGPVATWLPRQRTKGEHQVDDVRCSNFSFSS